MDLELIEFLWILGYFLVVLGGLYRYFVSNFDYFLDQGISGPQPVPIFGTWWKQWNKKLPEVQLDRYKKYGRIFGVFDGRKPNLVVGDPIILKKILIKDFDNFINRIPVINTKNKYANNMLIALHDYKWKDTRNALTLAFTSEKIQQMRGLMNECVENLVKHLNDKLDRRFRKMDLQSTMTSFTLDVIASCGFGTKIDCIGNPDDPFVKHGTTLFNNEGLSKNPIVLLLSLYPTLGKFIPSRLFKEIHYFSRLARITLEQRRKEINLEKRNDLMEIMLEGNSDSTIVLNPLKNDVALTAQILQFLLTGTDTTSSVLTNLLYNLVLHEDIQDKLRAEILGATKETGINFETMGDLPYLEQCIYETLRLYPPVVSIDRQCNKTTNYGSVKIQKGTFVTIPIYSIHMDPEFYPNPEIFDPERFTSEERNKRDSITYLPFGDGPRCCIGVKFAFEEIKIVVCHLLSQFIFRRTYETPEILELLPGIVPFYQTMKILVSYDRISTGK